MPNLPHEWDPDQPGSRFTTRVGLAILSRPGGGSRHSDGSETGPTREIITEALGGPLVVGDLGAGRAVDSSYGRGASDWVPVVEWAASALVGGVIGNAAWDALKKTASEIRDLTEQLREREVGFLVSRGTAGLLAIDHVLRTGDETDVLDVEAVEEPSALNGGQAHELNYVGIEPWLVSLINADRSGRYVIAVSPDGSIAGALKLQISELERAYLGVPARDSADRSPEAEVFEDELWSDQLDDDFEYAGPTAREDVTFGCEEVRDGLRSIARGIRRGLGRRGRRG